jgi:polysaccharide pyruvyl transferase WcaK-like protein
MTSNNTRILVLNDGSRYENWGIKACIDGLLKILNLAFADSKIEGLPHEYMHKKYAWEPKVKGKSLLNDNSRLARRFFRSYHALPRVADEFDYVAHLWDCGKGGAGADHFIVSARRNDIIVFNAEGSTYRDNLGAIKGLFMLWYAKTRLGKACYFLNGSVTLTLVDATLPAMIKKVFGAIDGIAVREPHSYRNVLAFYPGLSLTMIPDSVFALDLEHYVPPKGLDLPFLDEPFFCFSLSMLPMDFRQTLDKSSIVSVINQLKKIVPNAVFLAKDVEDQVVKDIARLTNSYFVGPKYSYWDIAFILSKSKFLFSGRYHHLIFAAKVGCPVIPMASSSQKIHGLTALFEGIMPTPIDPTDLWEEWAKIAETANEIVASQSLREAYSVQAEVLMSEVESRSDSFWSIEASPNSEPGKSKSRCGKRI